MRSCPDDYEFVEARDLNDALRILSQDAGWRPISGGTDVMVLFNAGQLSFRRLLGIRRIAELTQISTSSEAMRIGAAATYAAIQRTEAIRKEFPLLCQAAGWTGSIANQNRGTLGGNIANGSPAADSPPALLVYDAELEVVSTRGSRRVSYCDFHIDYKKMSLAPDELIAAVLLPRRSASLRQYARKVGARKAQAISKVSFHAMAQMDNKTIREIRVALGSVAPIPFRCRRVEDLLRGQMLTDSLIEAAKQSISEEIRPIDDIRSTATYRSQVSQNLLEEFLGQLI